MTKDTTIERKEYAKAAMGGMLSEGYVPRNDDADLGWHKALAKEAFEIADAMIWAERAK